MIAAARPCSELFESLQFPATPILKKKQALRQAQGVVLPATHKKEMSLGQLAEHISKGLINLQLRRPLLRFI